MEDEESGKGESSGLVFWIYGLWVEIGLEHERLRLGSNFVHFCRRVLGSACELPIVNSTRLVDLN